MINKDFLDELDNIDRLDLQPIENPGILLQPNEVCYYRGLAQAYQDKYVTTGHVGTGAGISIRVAKGVSYHTGSGNSKSIRENVGEFYDGTLFMTNKRFILLAPKLGFDIPFKKLTSMQNFGNEGIIFYVGTKAYTVLTKELKKNWEIAKHVEIQDDDLPSEVQKELANTTKNAKLKSKTTESAATQIREYKALLDDGIITQEEFEAKKQQLLEL